jgi:TatD DNase family protein
MHKFWDVHTHQKNNENSIYNVIVGKDTIPTSGYFSIGIHPWYYKESEENNLIEIVNKGANNTRCLAIGECGLDKLNGADFQQQEKVLIRQIDIAKKLNKPLIIHCVKYYTQLKQTLEKCNFKGNVLLHGYNQNTTASELFANANYFFSIGKSIFNLNSKSIEILKRYFPKKILLESDDSTISIEKTYERVGQILGIEKNSIAHEIQNNLKTIFANKINLQ